MYLKIENFFDATTRTSYFSSLGGFYKDQPLQTGIDTNSSPLRGYVLGLTQGLLKIKNSHGITTKHQVDVLITDRDIAEQLRTKKSVSRILHSDEDAAWTELLALKATFATIRFISNPAESEHLTAIWKWSSTPPLHCEAPKIEW
jgi:hypothetical protein